jgi:hypothetical protein
MNITFVLRIKSMRVNTTVFINFNYEFAFAFAFAFAMLCIDLNIQKETQLLINKFERLFLTAFFKYSRDNLVVKRSIFRFC